MGCLRNDPKNICQHRGCPSSPQQPCAVQGICILITDSLRGAAVCNWSFRQGWCVPAPGGEADLAGLQLKKAVASATAARLQKPKDRPDWKRPRPLLPLTICSCQSVTRTCASLLHLSLHTKPKSGQEEIEICYTSFQQPLPSNLKS